MFSRLTFNGDAGWTDDQNQTQNGCVSSAKNNVTLSAGVVLQMFRCPSDPKPPLIRNDSNVRDASGNEVLQVTRNSYVAPTVVDAFVDGDLPPPTGGDSDLETESRAEELELIRLLEAHESARVPAPQGGLM